MISVDVKRHVYLPRCLRGGTGGEPRSPKALGPGWVGMGDVGGGGDKKRETVPNFTLSPLELFYGKTVTFLMFH